jgi:6,7-dimethyl-8-ribityllumazine synthase
MITRHSPVFSGPNYRVLVFHLMADESPASLSASLNELKTRGVSADETVVMDVSNFPVLPSLFAGAIRAKAYDCFVVTGKVPEAETLSSAQGIALSTILGKLIDIAAIRATPIGIGVCSAKAPDENAEKVARRAVLDALEIANSIDLVDEL